MGGSPVQAERSSANLAPSNVGTAALGCPAEPSTATPALSNVGTAASAVLRSAAPQLSPTQSFSCLPSKPSFARHI